MVDIVELSKDIKKFIDRKPVDIRSSITEFYHENPEYSSSRILSYLASDDVPTVDVYNAFIQTLDKRVLCEIIKQLDWCGSCVNNDSPIQLLEVSYAIH